MTLHDETPHGETRLVDKVRKLLAMAERSPHPDEADAFSQKAAALIAQHRLDPTRLVEATDDPLDVREYHLGRGPYVRARIALLQAVADAHGCAVVWQAGHAGTTALVAGFRADREAVDLLYTSLHAQASARLARERRATGAATQRWRRSFLFGFAHQVREMLQRTYDDAVRTSEGGASSLPALRAREQQVADFLSARFNRIVTARPPTRPTASGYHAGVAAAARADVNRRAVPGMRALGVGG